MCLSSKKVKNACDKNELKITKKAPSDKVIALSGNPNVGKSTVFNALTGLHQHTGNWPGKTVENAQGYFSTKKNNYVLVDLPGTYSLFSRSKEEEAARDFLCFNKPDACIVVCDATSLERNLNLVLQTMEICDKVLVCINLMDEAKRKGIKIDIDGLSKILKTPVVGICARDKKSLKELSAALDALCELPKKTSSYNMQYPPNIEEVISSLAGEISPLCNGKINPRWLALRLLDADESMKSRLNNFFGFDILNDERISSVLSTAKEKLTASGISQTAFGDIVASSIVSKAESIFNKVFLMLPKGKGDKIDRKIDSVLTSRLWGYPVMILLLALIFWLTISGANYPSNLLASLFGKIEQFLYDGLLLIGAPKVLADAAISGVFRVLSWVVSVMLPPMAIFFPLFTFLEDIGYLPRIAYNLDKPFKNCNACGKQALTMCMGFGCNAVGVSGCRIIDSPRERLIAILTNNFVPCNGRFPAMISVITIFFAGYSKTSTLTSTLILTAVILFGVLMTFLVSSLLSKTFLKGEASSFTLELPPYRRPQVFKILVRSILDRTLFVLGRAVSVAAPAGLIIWLLANITVSGNSLLHIMATFLDPFGRLLGLDGIILLAFILGFPANEIVLPIAIMAYCANGTIVEISNLSLVRDILVENGWTTVTACSFLLFSLLHFPCSTTILTIKKETDSLKWTILAFFLPTAIAIIVCIAFSSVARLFV